MTENVPTEQRFVLVHYHILKNAGSTIEWILRREFGSAFASFDGSTANSILDTTDLAAFLRQRPDVRAISSHHLRYPKPEDRDTIVFDCCFLRHPLDRLASLYTWARRNDTTDPVCRQARLCSPRDFAHYMLDEMPHMVCDVQVTRLAHGGAFCRPASEQDLETATRIMREMAVPGLVALFDESLVAAEYFLHPAFPNLRLHYVPQNITRPGQGRTVAADDGMDTRLRDLWGAEVYADLARLNQMDLELWRRTRQEVERRVRLVPSLDSRLADFRRRCAAAQGARQLPMVLAAAS